MKKSAIITGYTCNNNCVFCYDKEKRKHYKDLSFKEIKYRLLQAKNGGCDYIDLLGGEVTIRPDGLKIVKFAKSLGFKTISLTTNGRLFSYEEKLKEYIDAGVNSIIYSVHGHTAKLHDELTRSKGSFVQVLKAIENTRKHGIRISTNTTIVKQNYKFFPEICELLVKIGAENSEFILFDPNFCDKKEFEKYMPQLGKMAPYIQKGLDIGINHGIPHWHIRYFPLCYFEGYTNNISELTTIFENEKHFGPEFENQDVDKGRQTVGKSKSVKCLGCSRNDICEGVWNKYLEFYGDSDIVPIGEFPDEIKIELTNKCNLKCEFCFNDEHGEKELDFDEVKKIVQKVRKLGIKSVRFTGGEPMLYSKIKEILKYAKIQGLYVILNSNGTQFENENIGILKYVDDLLLSCHTFEQLDKNILVLNNVKKKFNNIVVRFVTIGTVKNQLWLEKYYEKIIGTNVDDWFTLRPVDNKIQIEDMKVFVNKIIELNKKYDYNLRISNSLPFCIDEPEKISKICIGGKFDNGFTRLVVNVNKDIKTDYFSAKKIGTIDDDFVKLWKNIDHKKKKICTDCNFYPKCLGGLINEPLLEE